MLDPMLDFDNPLTPEEIEEAANYNYNYEWLLSGLSSKVSQARPSSDLLRRYARHQQRKTLLRCRHTGDIVFQFGSPPICASCDRAVEFISDVQKASMQHEARQAVAPVEIEAEQDDPFPEVF